MNQSIIAIFVLFGAIAAFFLLNYILDNVRKCYKVVGKSNFDRDDVPDVLMKENMTYHEAFDYCNLMNEHVTDLSKYYYFIEKQSYQLKK